MKHIRPLPKPIIVEGKLFYADLVRACCILRFKKAILEKFPQLYSGKNWYYSMEYWKTNANTIERIIEMQEKGEGVPILLFIYKKEDKNGF